MNGRFRAWSDDRTRTIASAQTPICIRALRVRKRSTLFRLLRAFAKRRQPVVRCRQVVFVREPHQWSLRRHRWWRAESQGSKWARTAAEVSAVLNWLKTCRRWSLQANSVSLRSSLLRGSTRSENCETNLRQKLAAPRSLWSSLRFVGVSSLEMARCVIAEGWLLAASLDGLRSRRRRRWMTTSPCWWRRRALQGSAVRAWDDRRVRLELYRRWWYRPRGSLLLGWRWSVRQQSFDSSMEHCRGQNVVAATRRGQMAWSLMSNVAKTRGVWLEGSLTSSRFCWRSASLRRIRLARRWWEESSGLKRSLFDVAEVDADAYGAVRFVCEDHIAHPVGGVDLFEDAFAHHAVKLLFDLR